MDGKCAFLPKTDASENAVSAVVVQQNRQVEFFCRMLSKFEICDAILGKQALAVVEVVRMWEGILTGRHFTIVTDQRSVSFMHDTEKDGKMKNEKIVMAHWTR